MREHLPALPDRLPIVSASGYRIVIIFLKSRARSFEVALAAAKQAPVFAEAMNGKKETYLASFNMIAADISKAIIVITETLRLVGTQLIIDGKPVQGVAGLKSLNTLRCFAESLNADNRESYCSGTGDFAFDLSYQPSSTKRYILPCRIISSNEYELDTSSKATIIDQVQAIAVKEYCHFCPHFDKERTRNMLVDSVKYWARD